MPRKSENRSRRITIRLTPEEWSQVEKDADTAAVTVSDLARSQLLNAPIPKRKRRKSFDHAVLGELLKHVHHMGGNLNQIAKVANSNGNLGHYRDATQTRETVQEMRDLLRDALTP
jgi:hypothetical protein